jgi:ribosomal protein S12 methylthiotransferase accessory factor
MNQFFAARIHYKRRTAMAAQSIAIYMEPDAEMPSLQYDSYKHAPSSSHAAGIQKCVQRAQKLGLETFVLNQTREDVGLPVVKVIVPGMRQIWRRFAPGRLYDVPFRLGWIPKRLSEKQLNPNRFLI